MNDAVAFDTTIRRLSTTRQNSVSTRGMLWFIPIAALAVGLHFVLPQHAVRDVMGVVIALFALLYLKSLSRAMAPTDIPARVWASARGLQTDDAWLAEQSSIQQAHVCQPTQATTYDGVKLQGAWPWSVMVTTNTDRFWLLVRDEAEGRRVLQCLGRPEEVRALAGDRAQSG